MAPDAAALTLASVGSWDELNADTAKEGEQKFKEQTRRLWAEKIAVHWLSERMNKQSDLDGESALFLMEWAAKIPLNAHTKEDKVQYTDKGAETPGKINVDKSNHNGVGSYFGRELEDLSAEEKKHLEGVFGKEIGEFTGELRSIFGRIIDPAKWPEGFSDEEKAYLESIFDHSVESFTDGEKALFGKRIEYLSLEQQAKLEALTGKKIGSFSIYDRIMIQATGWIDHHGPLSGSDSSATKFVYEALKSLDLIDFDKLSIKTRSKQIKITEEELDRFVEFVSINDNKAYPQEFYNSFFDKSSQNMFGLADDVDDPVGLLRFIHDGHDPVNYRLTSQDQTDYGLVKTKWNTDPITKVKQRRLDLASNERFQKLEEIREKLEKLTKPEAGCTYTHQTLGKVFVNPGESLGKLATDAIIAMGYDTIINWNYDRDTDAAGFSISTRNGGTRDLNLSFGMPIRDKMWITPSTHRGRSMPFGLGELLKEIFGANFEPAGGLKDYIEKIDEERQKFEIKAVTPEPATPGEIDKLSVDLGKKGKLHLEVGQIWDFSNQELAKVTDIEKKGGRIVGFKIDEMSLAQIPPTNEDLLAIKFILEYTDKDGHLKASKLNLKSHKIVDWVRVFREAANYESFHQLAQEKNGK